MAGQLAVAIGPVAKMARQILGGARPAQKMAGHFSDGPVPARSLPGPSPEPPGAAPPAAGHPAPGPHRALRVACHPAPGPVPSGAWPDSAPGDLMLPAAGTSPPPDALGPLLGHRHGSMSDERSWRRDALGDPQAFAALAEGLPPSELW